MHRRVQVRDLQLTTSIRLFNSQKQQEDLRKKDKRPGSYSIPEKNLGICPSFRFYQQFKQLQNEAICKWTA